MHCGVARWESWWSRSVTAAATALNMSHHAISVGESECSLSVAAGMAYCWSKRKGKSHAVAMRYGVARRDANALRVRVRVTGRQSMAISIDRKHVWLGLYQHGQAGASRARLQHIERHRQIHSRSLHVTHAHTLCMPCIYSLILAGVALMLTGCWLLPLPLLPLSLLPLSPSPVAGRCRRFFLISHAESDRQLIGV